MSQRILDEREHRRGLVLGLTLAEILILLLFMLLLGLGHRLTKLEQERKAAQKQREEIKLILSAIQPEMPTAARPLDEKGAKELASKLSWVLRLEAIAPALGEKFEAVSEAVELAIKINPNDPPAPLRQAQAILQKLAPGDASTQLALLEKKVAEAEAKLAAIENAHKAPGKSPAGKSRAEDPALLKRTLEVLERASPFLSEKAGTRASDTLTTGALKGKHDWPPIITLSEAKGYFFESARAELSAEFRTKLSTSVIEELLQIVRDYEVDIIEVIGHTDEQRLLVRTTSQATDPLSPSTSRRTTVRPSNLDETLIPFLSSKAGLERLAPSDNPGLGLARAAAVVSVLIADQRLRDVRVLPLSGGQLIEVGDTLSVGRSPGNVMERRRIEIRARRSDKSSWQGVVSPDPSASPLRKN